MAGFLRIFELFKWNISKGLLVQHLLSVVLIFLKLETPSYLARDPHLLE